VATHSRDQLKRLIRDAFASTPAPDPRHLRGSDEGDEPFLLEKEFRHVPDWRDLAPSFLDLAPAGYATALCFFSPEAFRYYLPAYLLADLDEAILHGGDPAFHLWHGLNDEKRGEAVNPRRYGGWTWFEAVSERFAAFTSAEIAAIVAYLQDKAEREEYQQPQIEQALRNYWLPRLDETTTRGSC
jgi:hypothetical protein